MAVDTDATSSTANAMCKGWVPCNGVAASATNMPASTEGVLESGPLTKVGSWEKSPYKPPAAAVISVTVMA